MRTIALEEHFTSQRFMELSRLDLEGEPPAWVPVDKLTDLGSGRLKAMDEGGIDLQVVSHAAPSYLPLGADQQADIATAANDQLARTVAASPGRFAGFATLPMGDQEAAVRELDRAVSEHGFKGSLIFGRTDGRFLDHPSFFPLLERHAELGVPIYLHPGLPTRELRDDLYSGLPDATGLALSMAAWGWHAEAGLHALRMIASGVFDRLPSLQVIIGHMGEMIPFMLDRIEQWLTPAAQRDGLRRSVAETFRENFSVTTSGLFTTPPFMLLLQTVGIDRILYSVDYPFSSNDEGRAFLDSLPLAPADKAKISHLNAERLLGLPTA